MALHKKHATLHRESAKRYIQYKYSVKVQIPHGLGRSVGPRWMLSKVKRNMFVNKQFLSMSLSRHGLL